MGKMALAGRTGEVKKINSVIIMRTVILDIIDRSVTSHRFLVFQWTMVVPPMMVPVVVTPLRSKPMRRRLRPRHKGN